MLIATGRSRADVLEPTRILLLLQGAVLLVTTVEAAVFGAAFAGAPGVSFALTAVATLAVFVGRAGLGHGARWPSVLLSVVEGALLLSIGIDTAFALIVTHVAPPLTAVCMRFVLPVVLVALIRRMDRR